MEQVLFHCDVCHVFRLPPTNFLVSDRWEGNHIWSGSIQVTRRMRSTSHADHFIELWDRANNELFGQCPLRDDIGGASFQTATDSSRCFVIRIEQGDQFALLGINFEHNNDAFRFCTIVVERNNRIGTMLEMERTAASRPTELRTQGKISVDLAGKIVTRGAAATASGDLTASSSGFCLALPPSAKSAPRRLSALSSQQQQSAGAGSLTSVPPTVMAAVATAPPPTGAPSTGTPSAGAPLPALPATQKAATPMFDPFSQLEGVTVVTTNPPPTVVTPEGKVTLDDLFR